MNVLVVAPDAHARAAIVSGLLRRGFDAAGVADVEQAIAQVGTSEVDVAVIDQGGVATDPEVFSELRRRCPELYVIMLRPLVGDPDEDTALPPGVDDFVQQPVAADELELRLHLAQQRRAELAGGVIEHGPLRIDRGARRVTVGTEVIDLTRLEFDLLWHLASNPRRTFRRGDLLQAVWASSAEWQTAATVTEHVRRIRRKLEVAPGVPDRIVTVRGVGYRFEPEQLPPAPGPQPPAPVAGSARAPGGQEAIVVILDSNRIAAASPAALELLGAGGEGDVVGRHLWSFVAARSLEAVVARRLCSRAGRVPRPEVLTLIRLDGSELAVQIASSPVVWNGAAASQITLWDVDAERDQLRQVTRRFDHDEPSVVVTDTQLRIQSFNPAAEALYGWPEGEVLGLVFSDVVPWIRDEAFAREVEETFVRDGRWEGDLVLQRRDGRSVTVHSSVTMVLDDDGQFIGTVSISRPV